MATLEHTTIDALLRPYLQDAPISGQLVSQLSLYLDLLVKWNARTNLTSIREPEDIVRRHFGESLFAGLHLPESCRTLLDFGSGAGFPGVPIQLLKPELAVTLAESQGKKASFLREAVRALEIRAEVWADRVENLPAERSFDVVALRAVDHMDRAVAAARERVVQGGALMILTTGTTGIAVPGSHNAMLQIVSR